MLRDALATGKLTPVIDRTYPLSDAPAALADLAAGRARGRLVVTSPLMPPISDTSRMVQRAAQRPRALSTRARAAEAAGRREPVRAGAARRGRSTLPGQASDARGERAGSPSNRAARVGSHIGLASP